MGITGAPGSGKSTIVSGLVDELRSESERLAIVAVDPTSPFSGGAILGDRVRMGEHAGDGRVFIRSVANRGALGGISESTPAIVSSLDGLGFEEIIIETVGVGQSEVDIARAAHTTVVVVSPGWGDAIQVSKAGFLEIADVIVVNKADRPGVETTVRDLNAMVSTAPPTDWQPPIVTTIAIDGTGLGDLAEAIGEHRRFLTGPAGTARARLRAAHELGLAIAWEAERSAVRSDRSPELVDAIVRRDIDPWTAAERVLAAE